MQAFSPAVRDIFESFEFHTQIDKLAKSGLLYLVTEKFATIDLHPDVVSNAEMGAVFEELIRKFAELSNETAGEHFNPREVRGGNFVCILSCSDSETALNWPENRRPHAFGRSARRVFTRCAVDTPVGSNGLARAKR